MNLFEKIGIDPSFIIIALLFIMLVLFILYIILLKKFNTYKRIYNQFMEGSDAKSLESSIINKFAEIDDLEKDNKKNKKAIQEITHNMLFTFQKFAIIKYDAFKEMGGKLSFSICMLTDNNDGFILTSMHSTNEGCYTYIKEIIKGESFVLLGEEEKKALERAKTRKSCLDD